MMKRIMMIFSLVWGMFLLTLSVGTLWNMVCAQSNSKVRIAQQKGKNTVGNNIREVLLEKCAFREAMIHFYGGWARMTGRTLCNGVIRYKNGMLLNTIMPQKDTKNQVTKLWGLRNNLNKMGKEFLYVQLPLKNCRVDDMLPRGYAMDYSHEIIDDFIGKLNLGHVPILDVRGDVDLTSEHVERYFFKTDHHWNFDGAFRVFPTIAQALVTQIGCDVSNISAYISSQQWDRIKLSHGFCASVGRRTGGLFSGVDDLFYYIPRFKTEMTRVIPSRNLICRGSFGHSVVNTSNLKKPRSMFLDNSYALYGGDYDHVKYLNSIAPIKRNLLVVKDSFALPIIAWLTTIFERVDVVDLRLFKQMTVLEASKVFNSDIVAVMYNPGAIGVNKMWEFGMYINHKGSDSKYLVGDVLIPESKHPYNHIILHSKVLESGQYKICAKSVEVIYGSSDNVSLGLINKKTGKLVKRVVQPKILIEWVVDVPKGAEYVIALYPSEVGKCADVGAVWRDVEICRLK